MEGFVNSFSSTSAQNQTSQQRRKIWHNEALKKIKPSVTKGTIDVYRKIEENYLKSAKAALPTDNRYVG